MKSILLLLTLLFSLGAIAQEANTHCDDERVPKETVSCPSGYTLFTNEQGAQKCKKGNVVIDATVKQDG